MKVKRGKERKTRRRRRRGKEGGRRGESLAERGRRMNVDQAILPVYLCMLK